MIHTSKLSVDRKSTATRLPSKLQGSPDLSPALSSRGRNERSSPGVPTNSHGLRWFAAANDVYLQTNTSRGRSLLYTLITHCHRIYLSIILYSYLTMLHPNQLPNPARQRRIAKILGRYSESTLHKPTTLKTGALQDAAALLGHLIQSLLLSFSLSLSPSLPLFQPYGNHGSPGSGMIADRPLKNLSNHLLLPPPSFLVSFTAFMHEGVSLTFDHTHLHSRIHHNKGSSFVHTRGFDRRTE